MVTKISDTVGPTLFLDAFAQDTGTTTGLDFGHEAGKVLKGGVLTTIAAGTVTCSASSTSVVYIDFEDTAPTINCGVQGTNNQLTSIVLFLVATDASNVTTVTDLRNWTMGRVVAA